MIPLVIKQMFSRNEETETQSVKVEAKISKCSA